MMNPNDHVAFRKSVRVGDAGELDDSYSETHYGALRYNLDSNRFEGLHKSRGADIFGNVWRELGVDVASSEKVGGVRVGENLMINHVTGVLSAVGNSPSRINQRIITISPHPGISDFHDIRIAISSVIGTFPDWNDGSLTQKYGVPANTNIYIFELTPGIHELCDNLELPDFVHLRGDSAKTTILNLKTKSILLGESSVISDISIISDIELHFKDACIIENVTLTGNILLEAGQFHEIRNLRILDGTIHLRQCHAILENIVCTSKSRGVLDAIVLEDCVPINFNECIELNNIKIMNYRCGIVCNMSMFNARRIDVSNVVNGCELQNSADNIISGKFHLASSKSCKLLFQDNKTNLIRLGFIVGAKVQLILPDNTSIFRNIKKLELLAIELDEPLIFDNPRMDIIVKQLMRIRCFESNLEIASLPSSSNLVNYDIHCDDFIGKLNIGFNNIELDEGSSIRLGKHFISISACLNAVKSGNIKQLQLHLDDNMIVRASSGLRLREGLYISGNDNITDYGKIVLDGDIVVCSNNGFKNVEFIDGCIICDNLVNCSFINCIFRNCRIKCNASELIMKDCIMKYDGDGDGDGEGNINESSSPFYIMNDKLNSEMNRIILRNVSIQLVFKILPLVGGYCIDSTSSSDDFNSMDDIFIAIGCIFNRNIYLNPKIKSKIEACVFE
jgi:hypothetical protein